MIKQAAKAYEKESTRKHLQPEKKKHALKRWLQAPEFKSMLT